MDATEQINFFMYIKGFLWVFFNKLQLTDQVALIFVPILLVSWIYGLIISPLICRFYIVPKIEKKIGRKLGYSPLLKFVPYGTYLDRDIEISKYILDRYYAWKNRGERSVPFGYDLFALKQVGYTIDMVSKAELIFSFLVRINLWLTGISFLIVFIAACLEGYA